MSVRRPFSLPLAGLLLGLPWLAAAAPLGLTPNLETCDGPASCGSTVSCVAEGSAAAVNVRTAANAINTGANLGFDQFFTSRFLVIGDISGDLSGEPNGQPGGALTRASFDLGLLAAGSYQFELGFDYVVDATQLNNPDRFLVRFETAPGAGMLADVLFHDGVPRNSAARRGQHSGLFGFSLAQASNVYLSFSLQEFNGNGSSAAGIDNLRLRQVPEPSGLALLALACAALAATRGRARRR